MSRILAVVGLAIMLAAGVGAVSSADQSAQQAITIENETWSPDPGSVTTLDESNREYAEYDATVTVRDENGTNSAADADYRWYQSNGTVMALSGGNLDGDASAVITYGYDQSSAEQDMIATTTAQLAGVSGIIPFVLMALMLIVAASTIGGS